ncbi:MAG: hypothetical protein M1817_000194 [Caeruleum heppii]|nr:MAG: hypothetical protein M1817_000194 [Caeruleum heppii]
MAVPLAVAIPAAAAGLAYVNARTNLGGDYGLLSALAKNSIKSKLRQRRDRLSLFYVLEEHAQSRQRADKIFFIFDGRGWTYKETYDTVLKYGTWLRDRHGVKPKDIVAMDFMNSHHFIFLWLGLFSIGAAPAFINYNLTGKPLVHCIRTSTARLLFIDPKLRSNVTPEVLQEISAPGFRESEPQSVAPMFFSPEMEQQISAIKGVRAPDSARSGAQLSDMAILIYTSGTTGLPKPAIVSWNKVIFASSFCFEWMGWKQSDRMYTCMPLYHSSAAVLGFSSALNGGGSIIIGEKFSTRTFWKEARESHATLIQYVGETCRYLLAAPPLTDPVTGENLDKQNDVRLAFGNGLRPDVWNKFKERFGIETIAEFYAATEGSSGSWNLSKNDYSRGAIGRNGWLASALLGTQLAIVHLDWATEMPWRDPQTGLCKKVVTGEPGELLYKLDPADVSKNFQGYYGNKKASDGKVLRNVLTKGDAFFRTGDLVRWDSEGRWYFNDRIGDTFRWKSENVSTSEVSESLGQHPLVHEANVYGVAIPHHDGNAGMAAVVLAESPSPALMRSLAAHALADLPRYAVPLFLRLTRDMQTTGTNKQQKHALRGQGVDPAKVADEVYWLREGTYVPFTKEAWEELRGGRVKL